MKFFLFCENQLVFVGFSLIHVCEHIPVLCFTKKGKKHNNQQMEAQQTLNWN
jgi:hypothetical protein